MNVPNNSTHILQPLDQTANGTFKNIERKEFSKYFTSTILKELIKDKNLDVTTTSFDLRLTTLKPIHFKALKKILSFFDTEDGKKIIIFRFRSASIIQAIEKARAGTHTCNFSRVRESFHCKTEFILCCLSSIFHLGAS